MSVDRAADRIKISKLHNITFNCTSPFDLISIKVFNISYSGVAIENKKEFNEIEVNQNLKGNFLIKKKIFEVELNVVRKTEKLIGLQFKDQAKIIKMVTFFFKNELSALNMKKVISESEEQSSKYINFKGKNASLFLELDSHKLVEYFYLSFFGQALEGRVGQSILMSNVFKDENNLEFVFSRPNQRLNQEKIPNELINNVFSFLNHIQGLNETNKEEILNIIKKGL